LILLKELKESEYLKNLSKLNLRKNKLFEEQKIEKWEIPSEILDTYKSNELLENKELSFNLMLPKVYLAGML